MVCLDPESKLLKAIRGPMKAIRDLYPLKEFPSWEPQCPSSSQAILITVRTSWNRNSRIPLMMGVGLLLVATMGTTVLLLQLSAEGAGDLWVIPMELA